MFKSPSPASLAALVAADIPLTPEQGALIKSEISKDPTGRGYASTQNQLALLLTPYDSGDPSATPLVVRNSLMAKDEFWGRLVKGTDKSGTGLFIVIGKILSDTGNPAWSQTYAIKSLLDNIQQIDFSNQDIYKMVQGWFEILLSEGLIDPTISNSILYTTQHPSRLDEILGTTGAVITGTEFKAATS